jgi:hypothetical protein
MSPDHSSSALARSKWSRSAQMGPIYSGMPAWSARFSVRATCLGALPRPFRDACSPASAIGLHHDRACAAFEGAAESNAKAAVRFECQSFQKSLNRSGASAVYLTVEAILGVGGARPAVVTRLSEARDSARLPLRAGGSGRGFPSYRPENGRSRAAGCADGSWFYSGRSASVSPRT